METRKLGRARRAVGTVAKVFGLTLTFAAAAAGGALLHLGLGAPRRFVVGEVNAILDGTFKGKLVVRDLGALGVTRIGGLAVDVFDPEGNKVAVIAGVELRFATVTLVESLLGKGDMKVVVTSAAVDDADVTLNVDERGDLGIARAFQSKEATPSAPSAKATDVEVKSLQLKHLWVHGEVAKTAPEVDADVDDLALSLATDPKATVIDLHTATIHARGLGGKNPDGVLSAKVSIPGDADPKGELAAAGRFDGKVGEVRVSLEGQKSGKRVDAFVDVPETSAASVRALAPDAVTVAVPVSLHAEVHGALPRLEPVLHATAGDATVDVEGAVVVPLDDVVDTTIDVHVAAKDIDASVLAKGAPKTRVTAKIDAHGVLHPASKVEGTYALDAEAGEAAGQMTPAISAKGSFTEKSIDGDGHVAEPGAPTDVHFALTPDEHDKPTRLAVTATTKADLGKLQRVKNVGHGRVDAKVAARLDLATKEVQADASGAVWGFSNASISVKAAAFQASVKGTTESPRFALRLDGGGLAASGRTFTGVHANVFGSPKAISVGVELHGDEPTPSIDARAVVSLESGVGLSAVRVRVLQGDETAVATVQRVRIAGGAVKVDGLRVEGLGEPIEGDAAIAGKRIAVHAKGDDVDLAKIAALFARPEDAKGHLGFSVDLSADRRTTHGKIVVDAKGITARTIKGADAHVDIEIDGRDVRADVRAAMGDAGKIALAAKDVKLGGADVLDTRSWLEATGRAVLEGTVDVAKLAAAMPELVPLDTAGGVVSFRADVARGAASAPPVLDVKGETRGLMVAEKQKFETDKKGQLILGPPPWHVEGVDGRFEAHVDPAKNKASVKLEIFDRAGALATIDAAADAPLDALFRGRATTKDLVARTRLDARATVPRRDLADLPVILRDRLPITGAVALEGELKGSAESPKLVVHARGERILRKGAHKRVHPADVDVQVRYEKGSGRVRAAIDYDAARVLDAAVAVDGLSFDLTKGAPDLARWTGAADLRLRDFPLGPVAAFTGQRLRGKISGAVAVRELHRDASLGADLQLKDLVMDETELPRGFARVIIKDGDARAGVRLEQKDGVAEVVGKGTLAWGKEIAPSLVADKGLDVHFGARNFRIDAAAPFVRSVLSEVDGRVDAEVKAHLDPKTKQGTVDGSLALRDGVLEVPAIGERFHGVRTKVTMKPWGTLRVDDVEAFAPTGRLTAAAQAKFDGLSLRGGSAAIHINQGDKVPISLEGVPLGSAYGDVKAIAMLSTDGKDMNVNVSVPMLGVVLPQSTGHTVEPLELDDHFRLGVHRDGRFALVPMGPPEKPKDPSSGKIHAEVTLGDVRVKRDTTLDVRVTGKPIFDVTDKTIAHGAIRVLSGTLEVQGKRFTIDRGVVSFAGDPSQPEIIATAYWDAPDSTRVYADFAGTPKSGKLKLRAEPARTQDEIVALILFGSADGQLGASSPGQESTAAKGAGAAGGAVSQGVNKAISGITTADIETRVDTSESDNPRPELAVQLSERLSAQVAYNLGVPPPGSAPDRTEVTLDFRFYKGWSVDTTVGDEGSTALDLVWRHRY